MAVDFRLPSDEPVWFGRYFEGHVKLALGVAIERFLSHEDKLGFEFFLERKVTVGEIIKTRVIQKPMGWRYQPLAHGKKPCPCPMCIQPGGFGTASLKEKREYRFSRNQAREILLTSDDDNELVYALERMKGKWRRESPDYLARLLESSDEYVLYALVELLAEYRHPRAREYLKILAKGEDEDASALARECLAAGRVVDD